jgi:hypothetical protein
MSDSGLSDADAYRHIQALLQSLTLEEATELERELKALIRSLGGESAVKRSASREVAEVRHVGDRIYQREWVRCGKLLCKCAGANGKLHGPYWYMYWREKGRLRSRYIGKTLAI